jgi:AbrB family looped-hinge helix DNA binding protein
MKTLSISARGQIVIPKSIRDTLDLKAGMQLAIEVEGEQIVLRRIPACHPRWGTMRGMFQDSGDLLSDLGEERAAELSRDDERMQKF